MKILVTIIGISLSLVLSTIVATKQSEKTVESESIEEYPDLNRASFEDGKTLFRKLELESGASIPYAIHLPNGFDPEKTYPVLIGPGDGIEGGDRGYYWQNNPHTHGWIIVDTELWKDSAEDGLELIMDKITKSYKVEGGKFHTACWSANSAGIFSLTSRHASRYHSITGMAGNPRGLTAKDLVAFKDVKIQFVVGENDSYWKSSARKSYDQLKAADIETTIEIVPNAPHVMKDLIGAGFFDRLNRLR